MPDNRSAMRSAKYTERYCRSPLRPLRGSRLAALRQPDRFAAGAFPFPVGSSGIPLLNENGYDGDFHDNYPVVSNSSPIDSPFSFFSFRKR